MTDDLDRLLELARKAGPGPIRLIGQVDGPEQGAFLAATDPQTIIELIERVKEAEKREAEIQRDIEFLTDVSVPELMARLRAAEEVVKSARRFVDYGPWEDGHPGVSLEDALQSYDEAVKE